MVWQVQQAEASFAELLEASLAEGPQQVTRDGRVLAVLVPASQWERLICVPRPLPVEPTTTEGVSLKSLLLADSPKVDDMMIPERGKLRRRKIPKFSHVSARHQCCL